MFEATTDVAEIAVRLRRFFAARGLAPRIEETRERFQAELDVSIRDIDAGPYVIDRRPNRPRRTISAKVPGPRGFRIDVQLVPMLPQILTQYVAPPSPRAGRLQTFQDRSPEGEVLAVSRWFAPDVTGPPLLVVELATGRDLGEDFADAVLDRIAPRKPR